MIFQTESLTLVLTASAVTPATVAIFGGPARLPRNAVSKSDRKNIITFLVCFLLLFENFPYSKGDIMWLLAWSTNQREG